jgi:hypothetical protein
MRDRPALLRVERDLVTVLDQCSLAGSPSDYAYAATPMRRSRLMLQDRAAVESQLPEMADTLFATFAPELQGGDAIDVAVTSVGKLTLTGAPSSLRRSNVVGDAECASATHLVTGATVGAFAIATTAAKSGGSTRQIKGGNLAMCGPPREPQCSGPLMLDLLAISP